MRRKRKSIAALANEAATHLQKLVRVKAADRDGYCRCVSCGRVDHYTEMQGGHFVSRRHLATKLMEENVHVQCRACNGPLMGNMIPYTLFMIEMYGKEFVEKLQQMKRESKKFTRPELEDLIDELRGRVSEVMGEKGL